MSDTKENNCVNDNDGPIQEEKMMSLFDLINDNAKQIKENVIYLRNKIKNKEISTAEGLSILEVKNVMILSYIINLDYIILRKCCGRSIEGDKAVERLVEIRTILERIRPIEQKLKYQISKMIKAALTNSQGNSNDPTQYRADPNNMVDHEAGSSDSDEESPNVNQDRNRSEKSKESSEKKKAGIYVPPRLVAMHYDGDDSKSSKEVKQLERAKRQAINSSVIQELREEYLDNPTEVQQSSIYKPKQSGLAKEKQEYEETYFTRLPITRKEKHFSSRLLTEASLRGITNFEDISVLDSSSNYKPSSSKKRKSKRGPNKKKGFKNKKRRIH